MIITTSNVLAGLTPTLITGVSTDLAENITDRDFSVNYTSSDPVSLTASFGTTSAINYIAVAGTNIKGSANGLSHVRVTDGASIVATIQVTTDQVVVVSFPSQSFADLRINLYNDSGSMPPVLTYAAAGVALTVPNSGEQSGYSRQFLTRNIKQRNTVNNLGAPTAAIQKRVALKGTLNIPNVLKSFSENEWQTFLDFAYSDHFFIKEQDDVVISTLAGTNPGAYLCYEATNSKATAHSQTRALNNLSISYKAFTGL